MSNSIFAYRGIWDNGLLRFTSAIAYNGNLYTSDGLAMKVSTIKTYDVELFTGKKVEMNGKFGVTSNSFYILLNTPFIGVNWNQGTKDCPYFFQDVNNLKFIEDEIQTNQ